MNRLQVSDLWKSYGQTPVLQGVSLTVPAGSLTAVLGLSGCGKTTLLRVIAGFERAERGSVTLAGAHARRRPHVPRAGAARHRLRAPGGRAVPPPHRRGERRLRAAHARERRGETVRELLEMVGIAPLARRLPHELSGGEQQRVALARALARKPQALLLDEPFSSLDASLRTRVREEVHALLRVQGVTTVLVTHDQEEALSLADSVAVLRDGTIVQQGPPAELYERPVDERLARFLGAVNVIDADFRGGAAETSLGSLTLREQPGAPGAGAGMVIVRPEQMDVRPYGQAPARATNGHGELLTGHVEQCRYYGHDAVLHIRPDGPTPSEPLLARVHGEYALPVGARVTIAAHGPVSVLQ